MDWRIRRLVGADAAAFKALRLAGLEETPAAFGAAHEEEVGADPAEIAIRLDRAPVLAADVAGHGLQGIVGVAPQAPVRIRHKAFLWGMYVRREARGRGIGSALVAAAIGTARTMPGIEMIQLSVGADNRAAIALYRKFGFIDWGLEPKALKLAGRYIDEIWMTLDLAG